MWRAVRAGGGMVAELNWWQAGREAREHGQIMDVIRQWDHAVPPPGGYPSEEEIRARLDASQDRRDREWQERAALYDQDQAARRTRMLSAQATAGFTSHLLANANPQATRRRGKPVSF
jgi:hypothetical protein